MNVIVGQSGGPSAVINASLAGVYESAKQLGAATVYGMKNGITGVLEDQLVRLEEVLNTPEKIELLPYHAMGENKYASIGKETQHFSTPDTNKLNLLKAIF
jgi:6-phosphofructokinase 1